MASLLFTIGGAVVNALSFSGTNFVFSRLTDHGAEERKRHDLALKKLQSVRDEWNRDRMKHLDLINKRLRERNGELLFAVVGTGVATYAMYKYLKKKKRDEEKLYQAYDEPDRLWTGGKAIKELHNITSMSKKDIRS